MVGGNNPFYDPMRDQYFRAAYGQGAQLTNQQRADLGAVSLSEIEARLRHFEQQQKTMAQQRAVSGPASQEDETHKLRQQLLLLC